MQVQGLALNPAMEQLRSNIQLPFSMPASHANVTTAFAPPAVANASIAKSIPTCKSIKVAISMPASHANFTTAFAPPAVAIASIAKSMPTCKSMKLPVLSQSQSPAKEQLCSRRSQVFWA
jgi:hypothetical protein